jgi:hypothetical protein
MTDSKSRKNLITAIHWLLKILSGILVVISVIYIAGKGLPDPYLLGMEEALNLIGLIIIILGVILAWIWEYIGGVIILLGFFLVFAVNIIFNEVIMPDTMYILYFIIGVLFIISSKLSSRDSS